MSTKMRTHRCFVSSLFFVLILAVNSPVVQADTGYQPSSWSAEKILICSKAGITPAGFDSMPYSGNITRRDFCELVVNTCRLYGKPFPSLTETHPFSDTSDSAAEYAYMLGLTQGTSPGIFSPDLPLTREMAAVMLSKVRMLFESDFGNRNEANGMDGNWNSDWNNDWSSGHKGDHMNNAAASYQHHHAVYSTPEGVFGYDAPMDEHQAVRLLEEYSSDSGLVSEWARAYLADVYSLGILSGVGGNKLDPKGFITREQAAILSLNVLAYCDDLKLQATGVKDCIIPMPTGIFISPAYYKSDLSLSWNAIPSASAYDITIFKDDRPCYSTRADSSTLDLNSLCDSIFGTDKQKINASIQVVPVNKDGIPSMFFMKKDFSISSWENKNEIITGNAQNIQFGNISEAKKNMKEIEVSVWSLTASGSKKPSVLTLTVNKNVAEDVKKIFEEIYNGREKFPIKDAQGFSYRDGTSQHSNGTAIDINPSENYFVTWDGAIKAGTLWSPGKNPWSIPPDGDVVRAFNKYGWHWSPDMKWPNGADYMHFSILGK